VFIAIVGFGTAVAGTPVLGRDWHDLAGSPAPDAPAKRSRNSPRAIPPVTKIAFMVGCTSLSAFNFAFQVLADRTPTG
jgi:hypothetical protein